MSFCMSGQESNRDSSIPRAEYLSKGNIEGRLEHGISGEQADRVSPGPRPNRLAELRVEISERALLADTHSVWRVSDKAAG